MNKELLLKVKQQILAEPKQFIMSNWFTTYPPIDEDELWDNVTIPNCGTAACIAGWTIALQENKKPSEVYGGHALAAKYLEIEFNQANLLFYGEHWDDDLQERWDNATSLTERAKVAADCIDRFIRDQE